MKKCFVCNAESPDSAIICLGCGNMVDAPPVEEVVEEVKEIPKEAFVKPKASDEAIEAQDVASEKLRDEFRVFSMSQDFSGKSYGRWEYLKGIFKVAVGCFAIAFPASMLIATEVNLLVILGGTLLVVGLLLACVLQLVLFFGRLEDIGVVGLGWKCLTLVGTWIPMAGTIIGLCVLLLPRNAFENI